VNTSRRHSPPRPVPDQVPVPVPVVFGEVLFDEFPDGSEVLGGAPFNVAWHLAHFGLAPLFVSQVGRDDAGDEVLQRMRSASMACQGVARHPDLPTGRVTVELDDGHPRYTIERPAAWDAIPRPSDLPDRRLLIHGTLACRDPRSRDTLAALLTGGEGGESDEGQTVQRVVDVNLRDPWWERTAVLELLRGAETVKVSGEEAEALSGHAGLDGARWLVDHVGARRVVVTLGRRGAGWIEGDTELDVQPPPAAEVVDTVGAGDAFTSVLVLGSLRGWSAEVTLERAQTFAARVVGRRGATTDDRSLYDLPWLTPSSPAQPR